MNWEFAYTATEALFGITLGCAIGLYLKMRRERRSGPPDGWKTGGSAARAMREIDHLCGKKPKSQLSKANKREIDAYLTTIPCQACRGEGCPDCGRPIELDDLIEMRYLDLPTDPRTGEAK